MGTVPTDIIFARSNFLLYSYSSKNFPANGVNETNATGSALSHTTCPKGFGWPSLLGKIFFWSKSESWHGLILLSITQIFLLSAAQMLDGVQIQQAAEHFFAFSFHKNWCLIVMNWTALYGRSLTWLKFINHGIKKKKDLPLTWFEPGSLRFEVDCSTNWAIRGKGFWQKNSRQYWFLETEKNVEK